MDAGRSVESEDTVLELLTAEPDNAEQPAVDTQPSFLAPLVLAGVLVSVVLLIFAGRSSPDDDATSPPTSEAPSTPGAVPTWPPPPADHDPHVSGRPGSGSPAAPYLRNLTLVYVNSIDKPTIVDLTTGNQQELEISPLRSVDLFHVESGEVVTADPQRTNLPQSTGRAFLIAVDRGEGHDDDATPLGAVPRLCLNVDGCPGLPWTTGSFGDSATQMESVPIIGEPWMALALALNATKWSEAGRWTIFEVPPAGTVRIPTPAPYATIWRVTDS